MDLFRFLPLNSQVPLPSISLKRVVYTFNTSELIVITRGYSSQAIIPDVLRLQNIAFSFKVGLRNINTLVVIFKGDFVLGGKTIPVKVIYTHASRDISITAAVSRLTINFQSVVKQLVGLNLPSTLRRSISVPRFVISGKVTSSGGSELIVSSTEGNIHVYIIYQKTDKSRRAIAVEMSKIKLASVLNDVVGLDISGIPYFGTTVLPTIALTYAKHNINGLPNDVFAKSPLLSTTGSSIKRDLTAVIKFTFSKNLNIMMHYSGGGILTFSPVTPRSLDVQSFISAIPNFNLRRIPLPLGIKFSGILKLRINTFTINSKIKTVEIVTSYPGALTVFDGLLSIHNLMVKIKGPTGGIKVDVDGDLSISGHGFDVSIKRDQRSGVYILRAKAKKLPITSLISQFKSEVLPSELNSLLRSLPFFKFSINNPSLSFPLISSPLQIQLGGTPVISGYKTVHMASVIIRKGGKTLLVQGFQLGSFNLASFLKSITGFNFNRIAILSQDLEAAILISPVTLPNVHLTGKLSRFSVTKGLSVQANMKFPPRCSSDAFCAVALSLLGADTRLNLQGSIASANSFKLFAGVSNIKLGRGIVMSKAGFEIQGGTINSIGIVGAVDLSNPDIILAARVFLSTSGVVLEMTMSGCWKNAFGAGWLDICSLQSSVAMIPGVTLTGLALGGKVHIGYKTCSRGTRLVATGFVGIDVITPTNNYYYANLKRSTTIATILRAFCIRINVPAPLAQSGFPRGFISSFSVAGVDLPHVPLSIPQGYRFKGTLNILGLVASADVTIGLPNGIDFAVALPPINVRGLLRMSISGSDKSRGPFMKAVIRLLPTRYVNIEARGYLSVLGISRQTTLAITNTQYVFNIQGKMLHLFDAKLRIAASYGNIQRARFQVQGSFTNNLYNTLENRIKSSLKSAGQKASSRFEAARRKLDRVRGTLNNAESALRAGQKRVNDAHNAFYAAIAKVRRLRNRVNSVCRTRSCGSSKHKLYLKSYLSDLFYIFLSQQLESVLNVLKVLHAVTECGEDVFVFVQSLETAVNMYLMQHAMQQMLLATASKRPSEHR